MMEKKKYAKKVYNFESGIVIDRTKTPQPHRMKFDIDFRKINAPNPLARHWTYGGSARTIEKAIKDAEKIEEKTSAETRIVDSFTGEILSKKKLEKVI